MKKNIFFWIVLLIIVIAGINIFQKKETSKTELKKTNIIKTAKQKEITVKIEPSGKLDFFPESITIYFSEPLPLTSGITVDELELPDFIEIKPKIKAQGYWQNPNSFVIKFLSQTLPDTEYTVSIKKTPLKRKLTYRLVSETLSFTTPELKPISITVLDFKNKTATLKARFNFPVDLNGIKNFIKILDKQGQELPIKNLEYFSKQKKKTLIVKCKIPAAGTYRFIALKGLKTPTGFKTKKDFSIEFSAGFASQPIIVKKVNVNDLGDMFSINLKLITLNNRPILLKKDNIKNFIAISPEIDFNVYPAKGHLIITGGFLPGKSYKLLLFSGLKGTKGEILKEDYKTTVFIPQHKPKLMFLYKGRYFGTKGDWKFPIVAKRLKEITLTLFLIPEQNITLWQSYTGGSTWNTDNFGKVIKENYKIVIPQDSGGLYFLDLKKLIPKPEKGVYVLKAEAYSKETKRYYRDSTKFTISNISIIAKWNRKTLNLWVVNSDNATPVKNAEIKVYDYSNIEKGGAKTDSKGYAKVKLSGKKDSFLIIATGENDWTYLKLRDSKLPASNFDISGDNPERNYIPYIYFERDLYRPGETIHFGVIIRENKSYLPVSIPIRVKITDPSGKIVKELKAITDKNGFSEFKFKTNSSVLTGKYNFDLYIADKKTHSNSVFVEAFAPERISLKAKFPEKIDINKPFTVDVEAFFLFGAPASNETLKGKITLEEKSFSPEGYKNYTFGPLPYYYQKNRLEASIKEVKLNRKGKAKLKIFFNSLPEFFNPVELKAYLEVSEAGSGRVTRKVFNRTIFPKNYYIGLTCGSSKVTANTPLKIKGVVLNESGEKANKIKKLKYRIFKVAYSYNYYYYNQFQWRKNSTLIPLTGDKEIKVENGKFEINYTPLTSYDDLVVEVRGDNNFSQIFINGWGWYGTEKAETPETLIIKTNKKQYNPEENALAETSIPFEGKILWTVEADSLIMYRWQEAKGKVAQFKFKIPDGYPCVYVSALLIHTGNNYLVSRAFGVKRVRIAPENLKLDLKLDVPEKIKPGSSLSINIRGEEQFEATVSIVDEGILQITDFKSPDPYSGILRPIALGLESADGFGWLMKKYLATGGGMAAEKKGFAQPQFTKIVSIWSGKLKSDNNGNLVYRVKIPQYNGKLRVMVCAVSNKKLGGVVKHITVKSDIITTPTIPRFLTVKDKLNIPVTLINTTEKKIKGNLIAEIKNADISKFNKQFSLKERDRKTIFIPLKAGEKPGDFEVRISTFANGEKVYSEEFKIPIFPDTSKSTETQTITVKTNRKNIINVFKNYNSKGYEGEIYISIIPGLTKLHLTKNIIEYPYGCLEQVSTKVLTMLKLEKLLPFIDSKMTLEKYRDFVRDGIGNILSMQTFSGGFAYWPGQSYPQKWASAYATFALIEAKKAGFSVPETSINAALNYLESIENIPPFGYYVLSKYGRLQKNPALIQQIEETAKKENISLTPLMWYTAALYNCGKSGVAHTLYNKGLALKPEKKERLEYDFYTPLKGEAIRIFVGEEINYDRYLIESLIEKLTENLSKRNKPYYYSTQEICWSMLAIGNFATKEIKDISFNATLSINGKEIYGKFEKGVFKFKGYNLPEKSEIVAGCNKTPFYIEIVHKGYKKQMEAKQISRGITVRENLVDYRTGKAISVLKQGEIAILEVEVKGEGTYPNCAIEIPLAGGIEAENPRLTSMSLPQWVDSNIDYDYLDIRDEKVVIFTTISPKTQKIYLLVRGVTPGEFYLAPAFATVMYKPFINGRSKPGKVKIKTANEI